MLLFLVFPCLVVAVQPCMEQILIKKNKNKNKKKTKNVVVKIQNLFVDQKSRPIKSNLVFQNDLSLQYDTKSQASKLHGIKQVKFFTKLHAADPKVL